MRPEERRRFELERRTALASVSIQSRWLLRMAQSHVRDRWEAEPGRYERETKNYVLAAQAAFTNGTPVRQFIQGYGLSAQRHGLRAKIVAMALTMAFLEA